MRACLRCAFLFVLVCSFTGAATAARTIEFETTEVTAADVALSPDDQWLIFTMLGHLFRLPVEGGRAEQLTFGPYYDTDPVFSPDGTRVAFVSDRDGSEGNVFVLELATGQITQVTHESWTRRPTWTPDGRGIVYLRLVRETSMRWPLWDPLPALVRRVVLSGGEPETLSSSPHLFGSVFYLPDGRLAWTLIEPKTGWPRATTRIEVMNAQGRMSTLRTLEGRVWYVVPSPTGDGLYCRHELPLNSLGLQPENLLFLPLPEGAERQILPVSGSLWRPQFAVAADNKTLYLGEAGRLWKITLTGGAREPIAFEARVTLEIEVPVAPPKWAPPMVGSSVSPRSVLHPMLSPDGRRLVFGALGLLWQQSLDGGQAERLFEGSALVWSSPAFSPNGRQLAFVRGGWGGNVELSVFDFENQQTRTVASGDFHRHPSWSGDGQRLVLVEHDGDTHRAVAFNLTDSKKETLADGGLRPHFSADGQSLYFSANTTGTWTLYRLPLKGEAKPEPVTQLERLRHGLVSPDGKWLAFRRNFEIWVAPLGTEPVTEEHVRQLSGEGGETFAFTPDGSALIYSAGNRVWRHPLAGGEREEIPIRLEFKKPIAPPLLVQRVRVLDFAEGGFRPETSLLIEQGRIRWIGSERGRRVPRETRTLDAEGRFATPGLFDLHVHAAAISYQYQKAFLAYGVTSVREPEGWLPLSNAVADRSEITSDPIPRYFFSGEIFEGALPFFESSLQIYDEDEARSYVRRWKERGAHFIKVFPSLPWPLHRAVAEEARRVGLAVVGHGETVEDITKSVTLGYTVLEHRGWPNRLYDDVLQMLAVAGTRWDPTLAALGGDALLLRDEPERLTDAKFRTFTPEWAIRQAQMSGWMKPIDTKTLRGYWVEQLAGIRAAHRRGVKLQAGTDAPADEGFFGSSLHWELEFFVQAGLAPLEVLRIATQEAAAAVGAEDDLGTLEPGKLADLVLLDANPLEDIRNTQTIWRVIKGGWLFDSEKPRPPGTGKPSGGDQ